MPGPRMRNCADLAISLTYAPGQCQHSEGLVLAAPVIMKRLDAAPNTIGLCTCRRAPELRGWKTLALSCGLLFGPRSPNGRALFNISGHKLSPEYARTAGAGNLSSSAHSRSLIAIISATMQTHSRAASAAVAAGRSSNLEPIWPAGSSKRQTFSNTAQ